ncbi:putative enzyme [Frankia canadensis]|uniref:Putative enzyme n=1 Tax=Frankia canadensis TaxID=1836972 RepID=A0A2I2L2D3_9ACTN|nr:SDR family oxidoreductase [Frankia canadensis]SNQ52071.1 putative enzyme [Frankia canadensis]SOU59361.1 putative enzyme [Frankia canadensis]
MTETVLITGASAGLGAGMARIFAARGADLAITARRLDRLEELRDALEAEHPGRTVVPYALDVTEHDAVFTTFDAAARRLGHLDRIVVNAGLGKGSTLGEGRFGGNRDTAATNVVGGIAQCEAAMRVLYQQGRGQLVVISSVVAARGLPGPMNVYAASKAALTHVADGIRADVRARGLPITVSTIRPGYIDSEMQARTGRRHPLLTDADVGTAAMVDAIQREVRDACVPRWPWLVFAAGLRLLPMPVVRRML